jgi:hypothetical protein
MSVFSQILERVPPRVIEIPVDAWADDWPDKPSEPMKAGLRLLSESDLQVARASATEKAIAAQRDALGRIEAFNDHLMAWAVACALTDPNDTLRPYFDSAHENVMLALTSRGIRRIWEELEVLHIERSPLLDEAEDADVAALGELLTAGRVADLPEGKQAHLRRLLTYVLDQFAGLPAPSVTDEPTDA